MKLATKLILNSFALSVVAYVVPGFEFVNIYALIVAAVLMGVVNTFIRPVLQILFLPLTIVTFGITAFLINVILLWGIATIVPGFTIVTFTTAVVSSLVLTLVSWFLHKMAKEEAKKK